MIPNNIHFIFGLKNDFGGKPFSFIHFLAIYAALKVNKPEKMFFHYHFEPRGQWWERARPYLILNKIEPPDEVFGKSLEHYAHKADVIRLDVLSKYGGIYLDMDVVCLNPFKPLLQHDFVMGIEPRNRHGSGGLCNAVILSEPNSEFLSIWLNEYKYFDRKSWNYHSVKLPWILAKKYPSLIHVESEYSFFYPLYSDPAICHFWFSSGSLPLKLRLAAKDLIANLLLMEKDRNNFWPALVKKMHAFHGKNWHYTKLSKSYCVHLWENSWWEPYLKCLSPEYILNNSSNFSLMIQKIIAKEELRELVEKSGLSFEKRLQ